MDLTKEVLEDSENDIRDACIRGECPEEFDEEFVDSICRNCTYLQVDMGSHPGGSNVHSVEYKSCNLGYWKEDF